MQFLVYYGLEFNFSSNGIHARLPGEEPELDGQMAGGKYKLGGSNDFYIMQQTTPVIDDPLDPSNNLGRSSY